MKVQKISLAPHDYTWLVLGDDHLPIKPITSFLRYLYNVDKSPNTLRAYANHLKLYWRFLTARNFNWKTIKLDHLAEFVNWLRKGTEDDVIPIVGGVLRQASSINSMLGSLSSFYKHHYCLGETEMLLTELGSMPGGRYKSLLYHVHKDKPIQRRIIALKQVKGLPKTITEKQYRLLLDACCNFRDRFLISLLFETGLRIGQALGLFHEDIVSWDNEIYLKHRAHHINEVNNKTRNEQLIHVSTSLMGAYASYINSLGLDKLPPYVFIDLKRHQPLKYQAVRRLFLRLSKKVGFEITPHMLRHTHATALFKSGWDPALIQKRLGHTSLQTTLDIYTHIDQKDLKEAFKSYQSGRGLTYE